MRRLKKWGTAALAALLAWTALGGCGSTGGEGAGPVELTIVSANNTHGTSLDPAIDYCGARNVAIGVCETLFKLNDDTLEVEYHLADGYVRLDDHTWRITVRDDIFFTSGRKLTGMAVKEALEYNLRGIARLSAMLEITSVEAEGQTLTIRTGVPVATLPRILSDPGALIFDTEGADDYGAGVIGTGPYILESMDGDGNCELVKNEAYWQGTPGADRLRTRFIADASAVTMALQSGELDYGDIQPADVALFEDNDEYEILEYENGRVYYLYLNSEFTFTQDPLLRRALARAFDRQAYLDAVYDGRGSTAAAIFPLWSGYSSREATQPECDGEEAKRLLAEAGYADSDGDGFVEKDGQPVVLTVVCYPSNGFSALGEVLQASLKEIGVDSRIVVSDSIVADLTKGNFNIATYGYTTLTMGDCHNFLEPVFRTDGSSNFSGFSSPEVDALLDELKAADDIAERKRLAIEIQKHIFQEEQHIFLIHIGAYRVVRRGVENVTTGLGDPYTLWRVTK